MSKRVRNLFVITVVAALAGAVVGYLGQCAGST
jgi:hypothetical protein